MVLYARDIVTTEFISLDEGTNAYEAARMMKERRQGFVVVTAEEGRPAGIVTEWDYLTKIVAEGREPSKVALKDLMGPDLVTVDADSLIEQVAQLMTDRGIRRLLVLRDGEVVGVITSKFVLAKLKAYVDTVTAQVARLQGPWQ